MFSGADGDHVSRDVSLTNPFTNTDADLRFRVFVRDRSVPRVMAR
jgi:hypothetical protein